VLDPAENERDLAQTDLHVAVFERGFS